MSDREAKIRAAIEVIDSLRLTGRKADIEIRVPKFPADRKKAHPRDTVFSYRVPEAE